MKELMIGMDGKVYSRVEEYQDEIIDESIVDLLKLGKDAEALDEIKRRIQDSRGIVL
ncbi:MAG: hypothetical protein ACRCV9_21045 [Burkholderiaceae bacterium]